MNRIQQKNKIDFDNFFSIRSFSQDLNYFTRQKQNYIIEMREEAVARACQSESYDL